MNYQALYRKYRPKTFDDIYGQDIIVKTLKNIIKNNKLTHAYLFIGPRGTGKTSIAKIFAKSINCQNNKDGLSCEKCDICKITNNSENMDIIEMDAASNNGVDEIRDIKNHVTLLPTSSKYKVYIIDEVHMLTMGAFNALLKTLEEPPKHIIFILATTEPHKIPLTIKSRCQNFEFKPISKQKIKENLKKICENEKIKIEDEALNLISTYCNGGMRDAISLLDQLNVYSNSKITKEDVILLNGRISKDEIYNLFLNIFNSNLKEIFQMIDSYEETGKNFTYICQDIINYLKENLIKIKMGEKQKINEILDEKQIIDIIMMFNNSMNNMQNSIDKRIFFDLNIIQIINKLKKVNKQTNVCNINEYYCDLMDIRLNNIISVADKESLKMFKNLFSNLNSDVSDIDDLKIINLLSDIQICAASKDGIIMSIDNENVLNELYNKLFDIEKIIYKKINENIKVCIVLDSYWQKQRPIFVNKIKSKEKFEILPENSIIENINKILNKKSSVFNDFEDLIEIGE